MNAEQSSRAAAGKATMGYVEEGSAYLALDGVREDALREEQASKPSALRVLCRYLVALRLLDRDEKRDGAAPDAVTDRFGGDPDQ